MWTNILKVVKNEEKDWLTSNYEFSEKSKIRRENWQKIINIKWKLFHREKEKKTDIIWCDAIKFRFSEKNGCIMQHATYITIVW